MFARESEAFAALGTVLVFGAAYLALALVTLIAGIFYLPYWAWKHR
jgi:hypothetical protein